MEERKNWSVFYFVGPYKTEILLEYEEELVVVVEETI